MQEIFLQTLSISSASTSTIHRQNWLTDWQHSMALFSSLIVSSTYLLFRVMLSWWQRLNWVKWKMLISLFYFIFMKYSFHHQKKNERVKCLWKMRWNGRISYNNHQDNIRIILYVYPFFLDIFRKYLSFLYTHHNASSSVRLL